MIALEELAEAAAKIEKKLEYRAKLRLTQGVERRLQRDLARTFRQQGATFLHHVSKLRYQFPPAGKVTPSLEAVRGIDWESALQAALQAYQKVFTTVIGRATSEAMAIGAARLVATLGMDASLNLSNPLAAARMAAVGADRVVGISDTTRAGLNDILTQATAEGWSYSRTATEIRQTFDGFSRDRAQLIAVTETADAYESGRAALIDQLGTQGLGFEKSWMGADDDRMCPECEGNEGDGWIPSVDTFSSGDGEAPAHPGCRCATTYQMAAEGIDDMRAAVGDQFGLDASELDSQVSGLAGEIRAEAEGVVEGINTELATTADDLGGKMFGEKFRLKDASSISDKIMRDAYAAPGASLEEIAAGIKDATRFTMTFDEANYARDVQAAVGQLRDAGFTSTSKWRNDWSSWDHHGILARFQDPSGYEFELQFHTLASAEGKQAVHVWYEQWRVMPDSGSPQARALERKMAQYTAEHVPIPPGAADLLGFPE